LKGFIGFLLHLGAPSLSVFYLAYKLYQLLKF
jgi:hypothetical protein